MAINTAPTFNVPIVSYGGDSGYGPDRNMGFTPIPANEIGIGGGYQNIYSSSPGSVGYWTAQNNPVNENGIGGGITPIWHGSSYDFSGLSGGRSGAGQVGSLAGDSGTGTFEDANGLRFTYDYLNDKFQGLDPQSAKNLLSNDPNSYYSLLGTQLKNEIIANWSMNHDSYNSDFYNKLESLKDINPKSYYEAKIGLLGSKMGWNAGQNTSDRNAEYQKAIQELAPQAIKAGVNQNELNNILNTSYSNSSVANQRYIANNAASGGSGFNFAKDVLPGLVFVGGAAAGMYGLDSALSSYAAAEAAGAGGGAFTPAAGSGASFTIDPSATYTAFGNAPSAVGSSGFGLNAGAPTVGAYSPSGAAATQSSLGLGFNPTGLETSSIGMGGTTGAGSLSGIAGSEAAAGLGGANLGTGLTAEQLARYESANPSLVTTNDVNNASKLAKALTSKAGNQLSSAMQNFATGQTGVGQQIPALIRGNQNPFVMTQNQPIQNTKSDLSALAELLKQG